MTLDEYLRKISVDLEGDFLREGVRLLAQLVMEGEVTEQVGAAKYQRTAERKTQRNGYRGPRDWDTRVGAVELAIPKLRQGGYFPSFIEPRRRVEKALLAVAQQAYIEGVSTRRVDDLLQGLGLDYLDLVTTSLFARLPASSGFITWADRTHGPTSLPYRDLAKYLSKKPYGCPCGPQHSPQGCGCDQFRFTLLPPHAIAMQ